MHALLGQRFRAQLEDDGRRHVHDHAPALTFLTRLDARVALDADGARVDRRLYVERGRVVIVVEVGDRGPRYHARNSLHHLRGALGGPRRWYVQGRER